MLDITLGHKKIGPGHPPFIIAEMSANHNQSLEQALGIVEAAARSGAHALKLQTYTADTMTLDIRDGDFFISNPDSPWHGRHLYELYQQASTPWEWHPQIFSRCHELGLVCFSTPFDETAVDFLESLNAPCYKIASFENTDLPLIRKCAQTGKPLIISTGMANVAELAETVCAARATGGNNIILLKCTSTYPANPENTNLRTIPHLRDLFGLQIGVSDHTLGIGVALAAVALGATVIEKHFTLSRSLGGVDSAFSLQPEEMLSLVLESERAWQAMGNIYYGATSAETQSLQFRRSLYITMDLEEGDIITTDCLRPIRPGHGLSPKYIDIFLGKRVSRKIIRGTPLSWDMLG